MRFIRGVRFWGLVNTLMHLGFLEDGEHMIIYTFWKHVVISWNWNCNLNADLLRGGEDSHTRPPFYFFSLFTCTKEHIKRKVSTSELRTSYPARQLNDVKCKISWIWETRCLLCLEAKSVLFLVEGERCTRLSIVSCRFAPCKNICALINSGVTTSYGTESDGRWQPCYCVDAIAVSTVTKVFEFL
jgi:hypothetical protein